MSRITRPYTIKMSGEINQNTLVKLAAKIEKALDDIYRHASNNKHYSKDNPNLEYIQKWKEYRDLRVASDNVFPINSKQNLLFAYREKNQYNEGLLSEVRLQYRDYLNYLNGSIHKENL